MLLGLICVVFLDNTKTSFQMTYNSKSLPQPINGNQPNNIVKEGDEVMTLELRPDDMIILKKELNDGWWKAELNKEKIRIRIVAAIPSRGLKKRTSGMREIVENMMDFTRTSLMGKRKSRSNIKIPEPKIEVVDGNPPPPAPPVPPTGDQTSVPPPPPSIDLVPIPPPLNLDSDSGPPSAKDRQSMTSELLKEQLKKKKSLKKSLIKAEKKMQLARVELLQELKELRDELELIRIDVELLQKVYAEAVPSNVVDQRLLVKMTPDEALLEKMLQSPFTISISKPDSNEKETKTIALAGPRPLFYKDLLVVNINLNSISKEEQIKIQTLEFNLFPYKETSNEQHLFLLLMIMFYELGLVERFKIPEEILYRFIFTVCRKYREVPFHSFYHAFNVTQTLYHFLVSCQVAKAFGPLELLAMLIATLCHDADHPGLNNDFQKKAHTRIAQLHKKSILENHHLLQCMAILARPECNILLNLTQEEEDKVFLYIRDLILGTDMAMHSLVVSKLAERKKYLIRQVSKGPAHLQQEDKILLMVALVKCADISNEIRAQELARQWAKLVLTEFFSQSDREKELNLETAAWMDRNKIIISKEQLNFIEKLCMPLYKETAAIFPKMERCIKQMQANRDSWEQLLNSFFTDKSTLSNKSIWEHDRGKHKDKDIAKQDLSSALASRASGSVVKPKKKREN